MERVHRLEGEVTARAANEAATRTQLLALIMI
jgi:hypothetical protein